MQKCPKCGTEYNDELDTCPDCSKAGKTAEKNEEWVLLTKVANDIEFGMVAGLMEMGNIPVVRKVEGADGYIEIVLGVPLAGIQVFVPQDKYEEAFQLLNCGVDEQELEKEEEETEQK